MRWNFSSRARELCGGDAVVISIPKSGRTWVRTFLCAYYCRLTNHEMTVTPERYGDPRIPRIVYSHDRFEQLTKAERVWDQVRGKYLVPGEELRRAAVVLLARDPRDAFVSLYVQLTRRSPETPAELKRKTPGELLRDARYGVGAIVRVMNDWLAEFSGRPNFGLARYETLRGDPASSFTELLRALGEVSPEPAALAHALEFSSFNNMKKLEATGGFDSKILQPGDAADPESFKVRRGKVGGYAEYLSESDQGYAAEVLRALNPRFGYR